MQSGVRGFFNLEDSLCRKLELVIPEYGVQRWRLLLYWSSLSACRWRRSLLLDYFLCVEYDWFGRGMVLKRKYRLKCSLRRFWSSFFQLWRGLRRFWLILLWRFLWSLLLFRWLRHDSHQVVSIEFVENFFDKIDFTLYPWLDLVYFALNSLDWSICELALFTNLVFL